MNSGIPTYSSALAPRLRYCTGLLSTLASDLAGMAAVARMDSAEIGASRHNACARSIRAEGILIFAMGAAMIARSRISSVSGARFISREISPLTLVARTVSSLLREVAPSCSRDAAMVSVYMGSVVTDAATLTREGFDPDEACRVASQIIDAAKALADSKMASQYPNIDISMAWTA